MDVYKKINVYNEENSDIINADEMYELNYNEELEKHCIENDYKFDALLDSFFETSL